MINIYIAPGFLHFKNLNSLRQYDKIKIVNNMDDADVIYSPEHYYPIQSNKVCIYGPHFSVFPDQKFYDFLSNWEKNACYIIPSEWCIELWAKKMDNSIKSMMKSVPFGVDTTIFNELRSINNREQVFIYAKSRDPYEIKYVEDFLQRKGVSYKIFNYDNKYNEQEYLTYLQNSKYGIVVGRHESQGFAIEEALSCNVPLLVWNVKSMNQEWGANYEDIYGTSIPYWDNRCGEYFYEANELEQTYNMFISKLYEYKPRNYIIENLSMDKCQDILLNLIKELKRYVK